MSQNVQKNNLRGTQIYLYIFIILVGDSKSIKLDKPILYLNYF